MSLARFAVISAAAVALPALAQAQLAQVRVLPAALAVELAQAAVAACTAKNFNVSATVVDRSGVVLATIRAERAGPHTLDSARAKAFTAASAKSSTGAMAEAAANNAGARNLVYIPGFLLLAGGVPVKAGDEVVGAIGVGGAPGGNLDEECANAGLQAIAAKLK